MKPRILLVDDDEVILAGLSEGLEHEGFETLRAASAQEALDRFAARPPDLVLTDLVLEGADGIDLMRRVRERNPDIPVMVITGHGSASNAIEALRQGAADYIQKPARAGEIAHRIRAVLDAAGLRRKLALEQDRQRERRRRDDRRVLRAERARSLRALASGIDGLLAGPLDRLRRAARQLAAGLPADSPLRGPAQDVDRAIRPLDGLTRSLKRLVSPPHARRSVVDLNGVVRKHLESDGHAQRLRLDSQVRFTAEPGGEPLPVLGSSEPLTRMLSALVDAAFGALPRGGRVWLSTGRTDSGPEPEEGAGAAPGARLVVGFSAPLEPDVLERMFEPFTFLPEGADPGTIGFALSDAEAFARSLRGRLWARSDGRGGTEWVFDVSLAPPETAPAGAGTAIRGSEEILVVDDHPGARRSARRLLEGLGYRVCEAGNAADAVERIRSRGAGQAALPDLALVDLVLGDRMDGTEVCRQLFDLAPDLRILLMGGFVETERVAEARRMGVSDYLRKPLSRDSLGNAIRRALDRD